MENEIVFVGEVSPHAAMIRIIRRAPLMRGDVAPPQRPPGASQNAMYSEDVVL